MKLYRCIKSGNITLRGKVIKVVEGVYYNMDHYNTNNSLFVDEGKILLTDDSFNVVNTKEETKETIK